MTRAPESDAARVPVLPPPIGAGGAPRAAHLDPELLLARAREQPVVAARGGAVRARAPRSSPAPSPRRARTTPASPAAASRSCRRRCACGASERHAGRGVTIAFLDSGFFAHPDLVQPRDRILHYLDVTPPAARTRRDLERPDESSWHGMMTSVVACGNGWLSGGLYRGLASEARLVLVKVGTARRIQHDDIRRGLEWVVRNRRALRHPHRQRQLRRRLRGELPRRRPLAGGRGGDARGPRRRGRRRQPRQQAGPPRDPAGLGAVRAHRGRPRRQEPARRSRATTCTTRATGRRSTGCRSPR